MVALRTSAGVPQRFEVGGGAPDKIEMPASEGRQAFIFVALFYQGDVQWENRLDGNVTRQNLCDWILFHPRP
jgi:hypothetical protein